MKNKDFEKARSKSLGGGLIGLFFSFILLVITYSLYMGEFYPLNIFFGVMGICLFSISFILITEYIESGCDPEKYSLCKRCKCLIKKDKIFCSDCRGRIRMSLKRNKDKKYFNEYKTLIKKEEKNKK